MKPYKKTKSFCPVCRTVLDTDIVEKNGAMFLKKTCPAHGPFEVKIARYAWYYKGLDAFYDSMFASDPRTDIQTQYTATITQKCDLNCSICFSDSKHARLPDVPLSFFKAQLEKIKNKGMDINFSGGEPTSRKDLPQLLRLVRESGNQPAVLSNGIKIASDIGYLQLLKDSGVKAVHLCLDTINNPEVYKKMRGRDHTALKYRAMENLKKLNIPMRMFSIIARGVNESEIKDLTEYARMQEIVYCHYLCGYRYLGTFSFSPAQEFLIDELAETVGKKSGLFTLEDIYYSKKLFTAFAAVFNKPTPCSQTSFIYIPRGKEKPFREIFRFGTLPKKLDKFERLWRENKKEGKKYFCSECLPGRGRDRDQLYEAMEKMGPGQASPPPFSHYYMLLMGVASSLAAYDIEKSPRECTDHGFNSGVGNNVPRCLEMLTEFGKRKDR